MMLLTNLLCLFGGVALGMLTLSRIMDLMCALGILKIECYNCKTGELKTFGTIEPERYED